MDLCLADNAIYSSRSQLARIMSETWIEQNMYCPRCGNIFLQKQKNNTPVSDFICPNCKNEYELKSRSKFFGSKIVDGSYEKMIEKINTNNNVDFFFMHYSMQTKKILNFIFVPNYFFTPEIIEMRKPLSQSAKRAAWVGCNILFSEIPVQGQISIISNGVITPKSSILKKVENGNLLNFQNVSARGWIFEVLKCVNMLNQKFTLDDLYSFETKLAQKFPYNNTIKAKIRQQLQFLRDKGYIRFLGKGKYEKLFND